MIYCFPQTGRTMNAIMTSTISSNLSVTRCIVEYLQSIDVSVIDLHYVCTMRDTTVPIIFVHEKIVK